MVSIPIVLDFRRLKQVGGTVLSLLPRYSRRDCPFPPSPLNQYPARFPRFVRKCPTAMHYWHLLSPLDWHHVPERDLCHNWGQPCVSMRAFAAACLIKLDLGFRYMSQLRTYLIQHPALCWVLGFDPHLALPSQRHFTRLLRQSPNARFQAILDETVRLLHTELATEVSDFGHAISLDTKHIIAWVRENNPKDYVSDRYDKTHQPKGDPDCRLGCKRRRNQRASSKEPPPTPPDNPIPAGQISVAEFYWGYGSGVVATKVPGWGEFVLAELTQPFDQPDVSYFEPLMADTQRRLGFKPHYGAFDAAFDAFYVYEYFHRPGKPITDGFAAVPITKRGSKREFDPHGLPLCAAGLAMPLKYTFICHTTRVEHERGRYVCPLVFPQPTGKPCPIDHKNWPKGCITTLATSVGARIRHQLDRESPRYKIIYNQRTATERINSQAKELGIERPKLRNGAAIANLNTLIYVLINLRALHRVRNLKAARRS